MQKGHKPANKQQSNNYRDIKGSPHESGCFESIAKITRLYLLAKDIPAVGLCQVCTCLASCSKYCRNPDGIIISGQDSLHYYRNDDGQKQRLPGESKRSCFDKYIIKFHYLIINRNQAATNQPYLSANALTCNKQNYTAHCPKPTIMKEFSALMKF